MISSLQDQNGKLKKEIEKLRDEKKGGENKVLLYVVKIF